MFWPANAVFFISTSFESAKNGFLPLKSCSLRMVTPHFYGLISVGLGGKGIFLGSPGNVCGFSG